MLEESEAELLQAWKVQLTPDQAVVIPRQTLGHLIDDFELHRVPLAPLYACHLYHWHGQLLPVFNLSALKLNMTQEEFSLLENPRLLGILAYQDGSDIKQGGVALYKAPELIAVPNETSHWPNEQWPWEGLADSCVSIDGCVLPVISTNKVFHYISEN